MFPCFLFICIFFYYIFAWTRRTKLTNWLKMLKNTFCHFSFCVCLCMKTHTSQETVIFSTRGFHFHLHLLFFAPSDIIKMLYCQMALWQYVTYNIIITLNTVFLDICMVIIRRRNHKMCYCHKRKVKTEGNWSCLSWWSCLASHPRRFFSSNNNR